MTDKNTSSSANVTNKKNIGYTAADILNWEQRCKAELQSPVKWNEDWGSEFGGEVPLNYQERIKFLKEELKKLPDLDEKNKNKQPFPQIGRDYRRKKLDFVSNT